MSFSFTSAPILTIPSSSRFLSLSSETFGMSGVVISGPSFVSLTEQIHVSMCIDVNKSARATRSESTMASSKLPPCHGMDATSKFLPKLKTPFDMAGPSASMVPFFTLSPTHTTGRCEMQVDWLERLNFISGNTRLPESVLTVIARPSTSVTTPFPSAMITWEESRAALSSWPVPTSGASVSTGGTACLCMFEAIRALFASLCSRNGTRDAETLIVWFGDMSIKSTSSRSHIPATPFTRAGILSSSIRRFSSILASD